MSSSVFQPRWKVQLCEKKLSVSINVDIVTVKLYSIFFVHYLPVGSGHGSVFQSGSLSKSVRSSSSAISKLLSSMSSSGIGTELACPVM